LGQEFFIKDANLEAKVRQLLPSQGGLGAGVDLSASTQIVPIVDLTESAEGSNLRVDLQTALTLTSANEYAVSGTTSTIITNTGFWRCFGTSTLLITGSQRNNTIDVTDGVTTKAVYRHTSQGGTAGPYLSDSYDFVIKLEAGESITVTGSIGGMTAGSIRQIADIDGNLINP
jgi:hypothetical protein